MSPCPKARHRQLNGCMTGTNWLIGLRLCMHAPCMHNVYIEVDAVTTALLVNVLSIALCIYIYIYIYIY